MRSLLVTDGYKFSMAEAGWPLRNEVFYYAHRRGGPQVVPFDANTLIRELLPDATSEDYAWLASHEYEMGAGFKAAITRRETLKIHALPKGTWFLPREPVFSVEGPSALVSWLEPLLLQVNYRIQVATLAMREPDELSQAVSVVTCARQRELVEETLDSVGVKAPRMEIDEAGYAARVRGQVSELVSALGDPRRLFEVGLRAATCLEQHELALAACKAEGVERTSNALGAKRLGLVPVGTMGHEHVQRYGSDDAAFRAMRERRPQRSSYLLDTYDTLTRGIPAAYDLIAEGPGRGDSVRYDSGDKESQYLKAIALAKQRGIRPVQILEDGLDAKATRSLEKLRVQVGWEPMEQFYGYGGYLVSAPMAGGLTRDRVAAVYKLAQTGPTPTMKFANEGGSGKQSVPGRPVVFRRRAGGAGPVGIIGQAGERVPAGYLDTGDAGWSQQDGEVAYSEATRALVEACTKKAFGGGRVA